MDVDFPERIGPYPPERLIGRGAMAAVYLSRDASGQPVAVKWMDRPHPPLLARFEREISALRRLRHPHIVRYRDHGEWLDRPYLVTDYVEGSDLRRTIPKLHQRPAAERHRRCRELGAELCGALTYLHAAGLVHRDVKPANVLLDADGRAILSDFGVVREEGASERTAVGLMVGTVAFAAPEQVEGGEVDARTDLFGLGATLYALLTGRRPYDNADRSRRPPAPSRVDPGIPPDLEAVVLRLMAHDPEHRYPSAEAAGQALSAGGRPGPLAQLPLPVAGRARALRELSEALDLAEAGHGVLVEPRGPVGAGRDWLVEVVSEQARRRGVAWVEVRDEGAAEAALARLEGGQPLVVVSALELPVGPEIHRVGLTLRPLGPADVRRTLVGFAPKTPDPAAVAAELYRLSGGLPALLRPLLEAGIEGEVFTWPGEGTLFALGDAFLGELDLEQLDALGALALAEGALPAATLERAMAVPAEEAMRPLERAGLVLQSAGLWRLSAEVLVAPVLARLPDPDGLSARLGRAPGVADEVPATVEQELLAGRPGNALAGARAALVLVKLASPDEAVLTRIEGDLLRVLGDLEQAGARLADASALAKATGLDQERLLAHALRALVALEERPRNRSVAAAALDRVLPLVSAEAGREATFPAALLQATWAWAAAVLGDRGVRTRAVARALHQSEGLPPGEQLRVLVAAGRAARHGRDRALFDEVSSRLDGLSGPWVALERACLGGEPSPEVVDAFATGLAATERASLSERCRSAGSRTR